MSQWASQPSRYSHDVSRCEVYKSLAVIFHSFKEGMREAPHRPFALLSESAYHRLSLRWKRFLTAANCTSTHLTHCSQVYLPFLCAQFQICKWNKRVQMKYVENMVIFVTMPTEYHSFWELVNTLAEKKERNKKSWLHFILRCHCCRVSVYCKTYKMFYILKTLLFYSKVHKEGFILWQFNTLFIIKVHYSSDNCFWRAVFEFKLRSLTVDCRLLTILFDIAEISIWKHTLTY